MERVKQAVEGACGMDLAVSVFLPALVGGVVQGVTGFGAGVVMMIFLPLTFSVVQSAGVSSAVCIALCAAMVWRYRRAIDARNLVRNIAGPAALYLAVSSASILFAQTVDQNLMKGVLGVFLMLLAAYFLVFQKAASFEPKGAVALLCIVVSGLCDGLFGVGGPLMVVYFMARCKDQRSYLGTIQCFFLITVAYASLFRVANGILTPALAPALALGVAGILAGFVGANKIVDKLDANLVRQLTYVVIGISGVSNLVGVLA